MASSNTDAKGYLQRVEHMLDEIEQLGTEYKLACKERRSDIRDIYAEARDHGVEVRSLKGLVKHRKLMRKDAAITEDFDDAEYAAYQTLVEQLGELGAAAADRAGYSPQNGPRAADTTF